MHPLTRALDNSTLSDLEQEMLEFERTWVQPSARKDEHIRLTFDLSPTHYYLTLAELIARPDAMAYDPLLVQRLHRQFQRRRQWRTGG